jgi:transcriptional regulator with XRE-family HTH domain
MRLCKARPKKRTPLQHLRDIRRLSIDDVASRANCDPSQVSYWERHKREPSREERVAYAKALGITVGELGRLVYEGTRVVAERES